MSLSKIRITCAPRTVPFLKKEVEELGYKVLDSGKGHVEIKGSLLDTYKLNLYLTSAFRVQYCLKDFQAQDPTELYEYLISIPWETYIESDGYFSVHSHVINSSIRDTRFANLKVKDAIVDRIDRKTGSRPDSGPEHDKVLIYLYWVETDCSIYIDTSGQPISKHGYRTNPVEAPMQECLAAAAIIASNWNRKSHFVNPMCGSGTLAIEAALMATNTPPGLIRENFGFMHLKNFDKKYWEQIKNIARENKLETLDFQIIASDHNLKAIQAAKENARNAGVDHLISFHCCDFKETTIPEAPGVVVMNPEYGERLGHDKDLEAVYNEIGDFFKQSCAGYFGYVFTGNLDLAKRVGLKPKRKIEFFNARIDCRLLEYELYSGSRRPPKEIS